MAGRRGNGEGSIYYSDKLNRWVGQFTAGVKTNGTPNRKSVYGKTRKDVAEKITKAINEIKEHSYVDKSDITLEYLIKEHIEDKYNANKVSPVTYLRDNESLIRIKKSGYDLTTMQVQKITNKDIKKFFACITDYSNSTINKMYRLLNVGFKKAVSQNLIYTNPLDNKEEIIKPKSTKSDKDVEALTIEQQKRLLEVLNTSEVNHPYKNVIKLMLFTGMRVGEVLALTKESIDDKYIHIKVSLTKDSKGTVIMGTTAKTYNSIRDIQIISVVKDILDEVQKNYTANPQHLLFYDKQDKCLIKPAEINNYLKRIAKKYNIVDNIHNHMMRHTFATRCIESGMTAVVLAKKLGHKDVSITLNTYTSVFSKFEDTQDDRFIKYLEIENLM
jgi:integrase